MNFRLMLLFFIYIASIGLIEAAEDAGKWGSFNGNPILELGPGGRLATVKKDFTYTDPRGFCWIAPNGSVVNGASIPRVAWSIIGGPWEGEYRNASILHDVACDDKKSDWKAVHLMFYEACLCGGVGVAKAKLMYWCVYHAGPRWDLPGAPPSAINKNMNRAEPTEGELRLMLRDIEKNNPSILELERLDPSNPRE